ncbi:hypothetical protein [Croceimicrobium hydrocarbonivorans]|uniref:Uncharacterized protein n=1 Tax=Croceimicrobium hydrocarbonivorans TaxID=2761580 RepID=A0A7H0VC32_9FLAO|nr:hypothetical protein [Croceimicrobium hydrocarbonivorans]QNR23280.1 hypothetical protein H4K34_12960 [Croceimicrobium hydrocarbonivorans]
MTVNSDFNSDADLIQKEERILGRLLIQARSSVFNANENCHGQIALSLEPHSPEGENPVLFNGDLLLNSHVLSSVNKVFSYAGDLCDVFDGDSVSLEFKMSNKNSSDSLSRASISVLGPQPFLIQVPSEIKEGTELTWESDSRNGIEAHIQLWYNGNNPANFQFENRSIEVPIEAENSGSYIIKSSDLAQIPDGGEITIWISQSCEQLVSLGGNPNQKIATTLSWQVGAQTKVQSLN